MYVVKVSGLSSVYAEPRFEDVIECIRQDLAAAVLSVRRLRALNQVRNEGDVAVFFPSDLQKPQSDKIVIEVLCPHGTANMMSEMVDLHNALVQAVEKHFPHVRIGYFAR